MSVKTCLLVKLSDGRSFLTKRDHLHCLVEFAKTFKATLSLIRTENPVMLTLEDLAKKVCDQTYTQSILKYETIDGDIISNRKPRHKMLVRYTSLSHISNKTKLKNKLTTIQNYIYELFKGGDEVSVSKIEEDFGNHGLSSSTLYRYLRSIRSDLNKEGYKIVRKSPGLYQCVKS